MRDKIIRILVTTILSASLFAVVVNLIDLTTTAITSAKFIEDVNNRTSEAASEIDEASESDDILNILKPLQSYLKDIGLMTIDYGIDSIY